MKIIRIGAMWCPSCLVMNSIWNKVGEIYPDMEVIEYDFDMDEEEVKNYSVGETLPVVIICDDNLVELKRLTGEKNLDEIVEEIKKYEKNA